MTTDLCFVRRFHTYVLVFAHRVWCLVFLGGICYMVGLVFVSDGPNEGVSIMALIVIAQLALFWCGIVSVCYTCRSNLMQCRRTKHH